jgi:hypothetical protein
MLAQRSGTFGKRTETVFDPAEQRFRHNDLPREILWIVLRYIFERLIRAGHRRPKIHRSGHWQNSHR